MNSKTACLMKKFFPMLLLCYVTCGAQNTLIRIDTLTAVQGDSVVVPVMVSDLMNAGSFTLFVEFDPAVLEWGQVTNWHNSLTSGIHIANASGDMLIIVWADVNSVSIPSAKMFDIVFYYEGNSTLLHFTDDCIVSDIWGVPLIPPVNYQDGVVLPGLTLSCTADPAEICAGDSAQLGFTAAGTFPVISLNWTSVPAGFNSTLTNPKIAPAVTTIYHLAAYDGWDTAHASVTLKVDNSTTPATPANMLPTDGSTGLSKPLLISWDESQNATKYDVYLWENGTTDTTEFLNLSSISVILNNEITYGKMYSWFVVAKNPCLSTTGPVQQFKIRYLPDLVVGGIMAPSTAYSGQSIPISWEIHNQGLGGTLNSTWYDAVYLSQDTIFDPDLDYYAGSFQNQSYLDTGQFYTQTIQYQMPQNISGSYFVFINTNSSHYLTESGFENNLKIDDDSIIVSLSPLPDLQVSSVFYPMSTFSGLQVSMQWQVKNEGDAPALNQQWYDRVYFSADSSFQLSGAVVLGTFLHSGGLLTDSSYVNQQQVTIPPYVQGKFYLYVHTDIYDQVFEHTLNNNNLTKGDSIRVFLTPPPDLAVTALINPSSASNNEKITIQYSVANYGADINSGSWTDRIYLSKATTLNTSNAIQIAAVARNGPLANDSAYTVQAQITLPAYIIGNYYVYVFSDADNQVFENNIEENNIRRSTTHLSVLNGDLHVSRVAIPDTVSSGGQMQLTYVLKNTASGKIIGSWADKIFISRKSAFQLDSCIQVGIKTWNNQTINPGDSLVQQLDCTVPDGITGNFYIYVFTDYNNTVFEGSFEGNNITRSAGTLMIRLSPWPDLVVSQIVHSYDSLTAGFTASLQYSVTNQGDTSTAVSAWADRIYITKDPSGTSQLTGLEQYNRTESLQEDSSYLVNLTVALPKTMSQGVYYFMVRTDGNDQVYEYTGEGNNQAVSLPFYLDIYPPTDLEVTSVSHADSCNSGQSLSLQYCVHNRSNYQSYGHYWEDQIVLSADTLVNLNTDIILGLPWHQGYMGPGQSYTWNLNCNIPDGLEGDYYLIAGADLGNNNLDPDMGNNTLIRQDTNGSYLRIHISLTPPPDLLVQGLVIPASCISGQDIKIKWTVRNNGTGITRPDNWNDKIYLSSDYNAGPGDIALGARMHYGDLSPGASYIDSIVVNIPVNVSGNYLILVKTDANLQVYEHGMETNNTAGNAIHCVQPPPADLQVIQVVHASGAVMGENFSVGWTIRNGGVNPATGSMKDIVYISQDSIWDSEDLVFGSISRVISLPPGATLTGEVTAELNAAHPGEYYVIVRTDVLNNIYESNEANNNGHSDQELTVDVPELPFNTRITKLIQNLDPVYYKIVIPAEYSGESMLITLKGDSVYGNNEIYLKYGSTPSRNVYDFIFGTPLYGNQEIIVPELISGNYYLLIYGNTFNANSQTVGLFVRKLDFTILYVDDDEGGNTGKVTVKLTGSKFTPTMKVILSKGDYIIESDTLYYVDPTMVFVTFDLTDADTGLYNIGANKFCGGVAYLEDAFRVVDGIEPVFEVNIIQDEQVRPNGIVDVIIEYSNLGNSNISDALIEIESISNSPISQTFTGLEENLRNINLNISAINGLQHILPPGYSGTERIYVKARQTVVLIYSIFPK